MEISASELEVMQILWNRGSATSFDIIDELKGVKEWNESTIRTLISRLQAKNAIKIVEKNGKTYTYAPILDEEEFKTKLSKGFLEKLYNGSISDMLLNFVKQEKLSKKDLESMIDLIEGDEEIT